MLLWRSGVYVLNAGILKRSGVIVRDSSMKGSKRRRTSSAMGSGQEKGKEMELTGKTTYKGPVRVCSVVPNLLEQGKSKCGDVLTVPDVEVEHVQKVYDSVASQWHGTRYKIWPKVEEFVVSKPKGSFFADVGCGNGKVMPACNSVGYSIGCDFSAALVDIAGERGLEAFVGDGIHLPFRSRQFDFVLCIAVLHHISTRERRVELLRECMRTVGPGGEGLFYAWAMEQKVDQRQGVSGHRFDKPDVLVPFHYKNAAKAQEEDFAASHAEFDEHKKSFVFQRYCHVYQRGELEELAKELLPNIQVQKVYWDTGNWAIILKNV